VVLVGRRYGRDIGVGRRGEERGDVQVDALAGCVEFGQLLGRVAVEAGGVGLEAEEELGDGDAGVLPHVEEEHGVGTVGTSVIRWVSLLCKKCSPDSFHDTDEEVGLSVDLEVDEVVFLGISRRQAQKVELFLLHDQAERA